MKKSLFITFVLGIFIIGNLFSWSFAADKGSIKVGWLAPMTGPWAKVGQDMTDGFIMYMEEVGYMAGGRKLEVIREDSREAGRGTGRIPDRERTYSEQLCGRQADLDFAECFGADGLW